MRRTLTLSILLAVATCAAAAPDAAETVRINVDKLRFAPAEATVHVGDEIEWTNGDFVAHTATARDGAWDVALPVKGSGRIVAQQVGEIDYFCRVHPNMRGHISVKPK